MYVFKCIMLDINPYSMSNIHAYIHFSYVYLRYDWVNKPLNFLNAFYFHFIIEDTNFIDS